MEPCAEAGLKGLLTDRDSDSPGRFWSWRDSPVGIHGGSEGASEIPAVRLGGSRVEDVHVPAA
jgi:hypothetical protein